MNYEPIIGVEVHVELATLSKMFCGCPADHFGKEPNTRTCPVCLGFPGALPVPNKKAVEWTILLGLALGCTINEESKFDRKHYFYPDLPKGYQISQYDEPLCVGGHLVIARSESSNDAAISKKNQIASPSERSRNDKVIRIRRVHLEEDTGKLQHQGNNTLVDFNRSGVPLAEIVTEPDFRSVEEVDVFVKKLQQMVRYLGISGADMEKGSMRIEPSVSLRAVAKQSLPTYRVEIKNINSFKFARNAITYEIKRQTEILERSETPIQQTRGFVESKGITVAQREKEEAHDYRYFPEPDIPPMRFTNDYVEKIKMQIPTLPDEKKNEFIEVNKLSEYQAKILVGDMGKMNLFQGTVSLASINQANISGATVANWVINKVTDTSGVVPAHLAEQIIASQKISNVDETLLLEIIHKIITDNPKAVEDYKNGKEQALGFLVGQVLRQIKGKGDAQGISAIIKRLIV